MKGVFNEARHGALIVVATKQKPAPMTRKLTR